MKITGHNLQNQIKTLKNEVESASIQFSNGTVKFPDEDKPGVKEAYAAFLAAEQRLARLQTAQTIYNLRVKVVVKEERMTLCEAIKRVGGAGRAEAMWKNLVAPKKDRYAIDNASTRDTDKSYAAKTYTTAEAQSFMRSSADYASTLRSAINEANSTLLEIPDSELQ